ncbi:MAG: MBL fold metallo-hydrolase [Proteobacteria bacterium]|nr:MBL fold metallo-hydrolase [Pseudomonadota bacterium]
MLGEKPLNIGDVGNDWLKGVNMGLDGGTMFGPVSKVLWAQRCPADAENTILMCNDPHNIVLVDTGLGNKLTVNQKSIFTVTTPWDLPGGLTSFGIAREEVTHVVFTHGDFNHAGGVARLTDIGRIELTCPNATHFLQKKEWDDITDHDPRAKSVYLAEDFSLLCGSNLEVIDVDEETCPGIKVRFSGGHTRGH